MRTAAPDTAIRLKYEPQYDLLSVWVGAPEPVENVEVERGVVVRVSRASGRVIGLEILEAAARLRVDAHQLTSRTYARKLVEKFARSVAGGPAPSVAAAG